MPSPISPSLFQSLIPSAGGAICDKLLKALFTFPAKFHEFYAWMYNEDGSFTDAFKTDVCAIDCASLPNNGGGSALNAPVVTWNEYHATYVHLSWTSVAGAAYYEVVRSTTPNVLEGQVCGTTTLNTLDDTGLTVDTWYFYFVRARTATTLGAFSAAKLAWASASPFPASPAPTIFTTNNPAYVQVHWVGVAGATSYEIRRNGVDNFSTATLIGTTPLLFYTDFSGTLAVPYYYYARPRNDAETYTASAGVIGTRT